MYAVRQKQEKNLGKKYVLCEGRKKGTLGEMNVKFGRRHTLCEMDKNVGGTYKVRGIKIFEDSHPG